MNLNFTFYMLNKLVYFALVMGPIIAFYMSYTSDRKRRIYNEVCFVQELDVSMKRRNNKVYKEALRDYLMYNGYEEIMKHKEYLSSNYNNYVNDNGIVQFVFVRHLHDGDHMDMRIKCSFKDIEEIYSKIGKKTVEEQPSIAVSHVV